jgi:hypothetical protein
MQKIKEAKLEELGKLFSKKGSERVSRIVAVIPMTEDVNPLNMVEKMLQSVGIECVGETTGVRTAE